MARSQIRDNFVRDGYCFPISYRVIKFELPTLAERERERERERKWGRQRETERVECETERRKKMWDIERVAV